MMTLIDNFLNNITMYRLTLYYLIFLVATALVMSVFGFLPFGFFQLVFSVTFILAIGWVANKVFAIFFKVPTNLESVYITVLILSLVMTPAKNFEDLQFLGWAALAAVSSKFIFALNKKHIFNPAAFGLVAASFATTKAASWWVGTALMLPFVLAGGLLIVRKLRRFDMVFSFIAVALVIILGVSLTKGSGVFATLQRALLDSPVLFFAFVMLTEPLSMPAKKAVQILYAAIVGFFFVPQIHFGPIYTNPELALLIGNVFSSVVNPGKRLLLTLKEKVQIAGDIYDFVFIPSGRFSYLPGQYLEWTLAHEQADSRGNRRYFTVASSPTEPEVRIGLKFYPNSSSFKKSMLVLGNGSEIFAGQLAGEFTLPKDLNAKLILIAGGIGITPFRSMVKYLLDKGERRPITLIYSNKKREDIVYGDIFERSSRELGIKVVYTLTDPGVPPEWTGRVGFVDQKMIEEEAPDWKNSLFYISGPHAMVSSFEKVLKQMGVSGNQIKVDFFPGFV